MLVIWIFRISLAGRIEAGGSGPGVAHIWYRQSHCHSGYAAKRLDITFVYFTFIPKIFWQYSPRYLSVHLISVPLIFNVFIFNLHSMQTRVEVVIWLSTAYLRRTNTMKSLYLISICSNLLGIKTFLSELIL